MNLCWKTSTSKCVLMTSVVDENAWIIWYTVQLVWIESDSERIKGIQIESVLSNCAKYANAKWRAQHLNGIGLFALCKCRSHTMLKCENLSQGYSAPSCLWTAVANGDSLSWLWFKTAPWHSLSNETNALHKTNWSNSPYGAHHLCH